MSCYIEWWLCHRKGTHNLDTQHFLFLFMVLMIIGENVDAALYMILLGTRRPQRNDVTIGGTHNNVGNGDISQHQQ
jgi:hypothetical protein